MTRQRTRVMRRAAVVAGALGLAVVVATAPAAAQEPPADGATSTTAGTEPTESTQGTAGPTTSSSSVTTPPEGASTTGTTAPSDARDPAGTGETPTSEPGGEPLPDVPAPPSGPVPLPPGPSTLAAAAPSAAAPTSPPGTTVLLDSGAWCWFEDERVMVDATGTKLYASAVADRPTPGEVVVSEVDMASGARRVLSLGAAELDDHNSAAIWESANGEMLTAWSRHVGDPLIRTHRRRTDGSWLRLPAVVDRSGVTYNNLYSVLAGDGIPLLYDFYRGSRFDPQAMASVDAGRTWSALGPVLRDPADSTAERPYVRYTSRGDRIDLIATETHPSTSRTSVYHGFIRDGVLHTSAGAPLGRVGSGVPVTSLTLVGTPGAAQAAWTVDIAYDSATRQPIAAYSTTLGVDDHRYHYARWNGSTWQAREIAFAGRALYPGEPHYTGLVALDPQDGNHVVISTDADPVTGAPLVSGSDGKRHWELFDGRRQPDGSFTWAPLTANSTVDNIRPVINASRSGASALAWMRGTYTTFLSYRLEVVGVVRRADGSLVTTGAAGPRLPFVAGISAPPVLSTRGLPLAGDFDSHRADDLFMYRAATGRDDLVIGDDGRRPVFAEARQVTGSGYRPIPGDFDGDGDDDILWYAPGSTTDSLWVDQPNARFVPTTAPQVTGTYRPLPGDYDGDGDTDILWYAPGSGTESLWIAEAGRFASRPAPQVNSTYRPAVGDADNDGDSDILWYAPGTAGEYQWLARAGAFTSRPASAVNGTYVPVAGDFDGDGDDGDVLFYAAGSAQDYLWTVNAGAYSSRVAPTVNGTYVPVALDVDNNGAEDVLWYAAGSTADHIWWSGPIPFARSTSSTVAM